ncbi:MAG: TolC family protein [Desulfobacteraceae bacterium]|jgi:outer membrane protein|nr:TolC family protein [Desulfobacteraceae bacterium]
MNLFFFLTTPLTAIQNKIALLFIIFFLAFLVSGKPGHANEPPIALSLEQAIATALTKNRSIINAQHSVNSAKLNLSTARSDFDIKVRPFAGGGITDGNQNFNSGLNFSKNFQYGMQVSLSPYISKGDTDYGTAAGVSLEIPLFKYFGKLVNTQNIKSSEFSIRSSERALVQTKENIVLETVTSFYHIIEQKKNVAMNQLLVEKFKRHTAIAQIKTDVGLAQPLDVYRAQIKEKDAAVSLTDSLERLQTAYNNLKSILSIPQNRKIALLDTPVKSTATELDINKIEAIAFENSIEIKSALDTLNEKKRSSKIAEHYLLPDLTVFFDYTRSGNGNNFDNDVFRLSEESWRVYLTSSSDFARTSEKNSYRQSLITVQSSELDLANKKDQLGKEVKNQVDFLEKSRERMVILEQQIQKAMGKFELSRIKFNNGMADNFDMIEAETELHRAQLNHLSAQINHITGTYRLRKTIGTLIEYN